MPDERTFLKQILFEGEERFMFVTLADGMSRMRHTSYEMTEAEVREDLAGRGMPEREIDGLIAGAREGAKSRGER